MQPELVLGEEEKKEVSINLKNQDELINEPIDTNASEASTSHASERPGIWLTIPTTIVSQDTMERVSSILAPSYVITKPEITEEENHINATNHDSIISVSSLENVSENVMNFDQARHNRRREVDKCVH